jgi:endonuclease/exonuclease/phosphatase family metal-dependent hydrolase
MLPRALRIATLNCLNLALPARRFYAGVEPYTSDEYLAKTQWLAQMLDRLAADFVLVQEVFHAQALLDVVQQTAAGRAAYRLDVPLADDANDKPRLGLIWRAHWHPQIDVLTALPDGCAVMVPELGEQQTFSRPLLRARVPLADSGMTLTLLNVHLKSRRPDYADGESANDPDAEARAQLRALIKRGAEAAALRKLVVAEARASGGVGAQTVPRPLIVAGDFNDEANAVTTRIVADSSWRHDGYSAADRLLFNALDAERQPTPGRGRDVAYSIVHAGEPERIDHIFVSPEFVRARGRAIGYVAAVEHLTDHLIERRRVVGDGSMAAELQRIYSDHAAVCVTLAFDAAMS